VTISADPSRRVETPTPPVEIDPDHAAALAGIKAQSDKVRYACQVVGPNTDDVRTWLAAYGHSTRRSYVSTLVTAYRSNRSATDTGDLPPLTPDVLAELDAARPENAALPQTPTVDPVGAVPAPSLAPDPLGPTAPLRPAPPAPAPTPVITPDSDVFVPFRTDPVEAPAAKGAGLFYLVAAAATAISIDTSWRFFEQRLGITNDLERVAMFAVVELALIACGWAMRASVRRPGGKPGPARTLAWALCGLAAYMAIDLSGPVEGIARVALGPVLGLVALHLALGIEVRVRRGASGTTWSRIGGELRERVLSRLGLADDNRTALARTRDRAADRAARLATSRRAIARKRRLARAVRTSGAALDATQRERLMTQVAALRHLDDLVKTDRPSPWQ